MAAPRFIVGFTGHRSGFDPHAVRASIDAVLRELTATAEMAGYQPQLRTSVAEGSDTLGVQIAQSLGLNVEILLPLAAAEFATDFSPEGWARAQSVMTAARARGDVVRVVAPAAPRPHCYEILAREMLRDARALIAVSDGAPSRGPGGTGAVIDMARARGIPVTTIHATTGAVSRPPRDAAPLSAAPTVSP